MSLPIQNGQTAPHKKKPRMPKTDEDVLKEQFSSVFVGDYPSFHIARTMALAAAAGDGNGSAEKVSTKFEFECIMLNLDLITTSILMLGQDFNQNPA